MDPGVKTIGLIAQELYEIIPEAVSKPENEATELWGIDYDKLIPVLIKAIQELNTEKEELSVRLAEQEAKLSKLYDLVID
jgi:hypothetical protein